MELAIGAGGKQRLSGAIDTFGLDLKGVVRSICEKFDV
jgi:hypothetical protein